MKTGEEKRHTAIAETTPELAMPLFVASWIFFAALLLVYYFPTLSGKADFFISDSAYFFEPLCRFVGEQLKAGRLPLWNPMLYCGMSQAAVPSPSIFYPPSYFVFLLPYSQGVSLYMIFHHFLMAAGTYLYLRHLNFARPSALFAALSAGLMSYFFALTRNFTLPAVVAWLPLTLFLQEQIDTRRSIAQALFRIAFAICVSMFVFAGRPELFVACLGIVAANAAYLIGKKLSAKETDQAEKEDSSKLKSALHLTIAICIPMIAGVFIASPVILPAIEWSAISPRAHGQKLEDVFSWSAGIYDFIAMMFSFPVGDFCDLGWDGAIKRALFTGSHGSLPFLSTCYLGPIILSPACWALCNKQWKWKSLWLVFLAGSWIICAGQYTPVLPFLVKIFPALTVLRYPIKLIVFPVLLLIIAACVGFDLLLKKQINKKLLIASLGFYILSVVLAGAIYFIPEFMIIGAQYASQSLYAKTIHEINIVFANSLLNCGLIGIAFCTSAYFYLAGKLSFNPFITMVIAGLGTSLLGSAVSYPFTVQTDFFNAPSKLFAHLTKFSQENISNGCRWRILPFYPISGMRLPDAYMKDQKVSSTAKFHIYARSLGYFNMCLDFGLPQSFGYEAAATGEYWELYNEALQYSSQFLTGQHPKAISDLPIYRFCKYTGTKFLLTQESLLPDGSPLPVMDDRLFKLFGHSSSNNSRIYETNPLPRIYFADEVRKLDDWTAFKKAIWNPDLVDSDSSKSKPVYLLNSDLTKLLAEPLQAPEDSLNICSLVSEKADELQINTENRKPSILVVSDQNYPGWIAEIDGKRVPIMKANLFARAVLMPPGKHKLTMQFEPESVKTGLITLGSTLILLVILAILL